MNFIEAEHVNGAVRSLDFDVAIVSSVPLKVPAIRARLDQIIDLDHALVRLARAIDWRFLEEKLGAVYTDEPGRPPLPTRLMAGLSKVHVGTGVVS